MAMLYRMTNLRKFLSYIVTMYCFALVKYMYLVITIPGK